MYIYFFIICLRYLECSINIEKHIANAIKFKNWCLSFKMVLTVFLSCKSILIIN